jgi:RNA polymerase sigma-70 factor (ECF subfamily)
MTPIETRRRRLVGGGRDLVHAPGDHPPAGRRRPHPRQHARSTADDLGRRLAEGDTEALQQIYATYGGPMMTAALHHLAGDRRLAEEAVQAALLKAWRSAATFDPTRPLAPWLYAIVRHCAIDLRRHEQRHNLASPDAVAGNLGADDPFESAAIAWTVRAALERLPVKEHSVIRLMYFEGLSQGEVAARLDIPLGTVKTRAARAHHRLRVVLGSRAASGRPSHLR